MPTVRSGTQEGNTMADKKDDKHHYTFESLRKGGFCLYSYVRGSQACGLATPQSDTDHGGVFIPPLYHLFGLPSRYVPDVRSERSDDVWYDIRKYFQLLSESDPNTTESLFVPKRCQEYVHPLFKEVLKNRKMFLTKKLAFRFMEFALSQVRKARGANKKVNNPITERQTIEDFCHILLQPSTNGIPLKQWAEETGVDLNRCALSNVDNFPNVYNVFYDSDGSLGFKGMFAENGTQVKFTPGIPRTLDRICLLYVSHDRFSKHCKEYKEWQNWDANKNPVRYDTNLGKTYDSKNMMQCFRLLAVAEEIASGKGFIVDRTGIDAGFLNDIRNHKYDYDELADMAVDKSLKVDYALDNCKLPENVDPDKLEWLLLEISEKFYITKKW